MAKILLINPIIRAHDVPKHIPYGLAILASIAIKNGHLVQIYDANAWRKDDDILKDVFQADDWDVVAIGGLITAYRSIKHIVKLCREVLPDVFIIAGGGFFTCMPREMMNWLKEINLGIVGEAFETWPDVLNKIDNNKYDFSETLGVCYRDNHGEAHLTKVRPNIPSLDILPYPDWDLLPMDIYFSNSQMLGSEEVFTCKRRIDINGSLGCSLICKYCWHLGTTGDMIIEPDADGKNDVRFTYGRNIRFHSARYLVDMVKHLVQKFNIDFCSFIDENLMTMHVSSRHKWLFELSELWIQEGLQPSCRRKKMKHDESCEGVHWAGTSHAGLASKDVLKAMYEAGCASLIYGIESFDPLILKNLGKGASQRANIESLRTCLSVGIHPIPNLIIGFPEETFDSIRTTIKWMIELGIHAKPHFATAYPGSEWYYKYKDSLIEQYGSLEDFVEDLGDASTITGTISHNFSPGMLLGLQEIVYRKDLRLLDLTEKHWKQNMQNNIQPFVTPQNSFNMITKKVNAPLGN